MNAAWHLRLAGGLGNQLFQFGMASWLAARHGGAITVCDATGRYSTARAQTLSDVLKVPPPPTPAWARVCHRLRLGRAPLPSCINDANAFETLRRPPGMLRGPQLIDGYFQSCWDDRSIIDMVASVRRKASAFKPSREVTMHVRGGDFLRLPAYNLVGASFYRTALQHIRQQLGDEVLRISVVTDDPVHAQTIVEQCALGPAYVFQIAGPASPKEDFERLRRARARVFANSTFAWWAAALGEPDAPTVCLGRWTTQHRREFFLPNETVVA